MLQMEWFFGIVVAVTLALLVYAVLSSRVAINKKVQPVVDALDDLAHIAVSAKAYRPDDNKNLD